MCFSAVVWVGCGDASYEEDSDENPAACTDPNPSETCQDTGCPDGQSCLPSSDDACVPSACTCEDGVWGCSADCGASYACVAVSDCAAEPDLSGAEGACTPGTTCTYGEECCCGSCSPSLVCTCTESGGSLCSYTDACLIASCEGQSCQDTSDCQMGALAEPGLEALVCADGLCQRESVVCGPNPAETCLDTGCPSGLECTPTDSGGCRPSGCSCDPEGGWLCTTDCGQDYRCVETSNAPACETLDRTSCDTRDGCRWLWASGCPSDPQIALVEDVCLPDFGECQDNTDCPQGTTCRLFEVLPECAVADDPSEPVCGACSMTVGLCSP